MPLLVANMTKSHEKDILERSFCKIMKIEIMQDRFQKKKSQTDGFPGRIRFLEYILNVIGLKIFQFTYFLHVVDVFILSTRKIRRRVLVWSCTAHH